jgi:hypothetical protein
MRATDTTSKRRVIVPVGQAPIVPKTPPNPLGNDLDFLDDFPYLADPW